MDLTKLINTLQTSIAKAAVFCCPKRGNRAMRHPLYQSEAKSVEVFQKDIVTRDNPITCHPTCLFHFPTDPISLTVFSPYSLRSRDHPGHPSSRSISPFLVYRSHVTITSFYRWHPLSFSVIWPQLQPSHLFLVIPLARCDHEFFTGAVPSFLPCLPS